MRIWRSRCRRGLLGLRVGGGRGLGSIGGACGLTGCFGARMEISAGERFGIGSWEGEG